MKILCLLLVGTFVLSKVHAENSNTPIRRFHGYKKSMVETDARSMTGGLKSSARQIESVRKGRDVRARKYSRVTIGPMGYRKTIKSQLPVQSGKMKKFMGLSRLNSSQRRRSLDVGYSTQNSLKRSQYSYNHKEVSNVIHLEPLVHKVHRNNIFDWMLTFLSRIIGSDKINYSKTMTSVKNFGPLLGPVNFPGIDGNVYIRQLDPVHEEADHVVIHLVQKVSSSPHEFPMKSANSVSLDSLAKSSTIRSALLPPNASAYLDKTSLPANHRNGEKNTSNVNTLGIRYSKPLLLQNIRGHNSLIQNMHPGLDGGKNFIPLSQRPYESHEYHSAISNIRPPAIEQTLSNIRQKKKGSSYNKGNMMTFPLESSQKIKNLSIYPPLPAKSRNAEEKNQDSLYPVENILSQESQIIRSNRIVPSSASFKQLQTQMNMGGGLKIVTPPILSGGSRSNLKNSNSNNIQETYTIAPINYSSHHYDNKELMKVEKSAVRNDKKIINSTSTIENVTHKSTPGVIIVTPNNPWHYDKTTHKLQQDIKPVYEIQNDYQDSTRLGKSNNITLTSIDRKLVKST
ncbi:uncharacterized protein LOC107263441 isoform X2 [Cephus cinctus]|uniref:Uncharacterized protein LOC107263441 isoform X2 n=1 Tax=Cephus cinctus TaxID=211228 RepID=A0AAJ7BHJ8_CEPCN|nr:uncharacterized protein LOC107263441 isoform X2 [Cephus cinctus]